ncbi:MAG: OmpA family protein [Myxococcota bacterium]
MIALVTLAVAAEPPPDPRPLGFGPEVALRAQVGIGAQRDIPTFLGLGASIAVAPFSQLHLELAADGGPEIDGTAWLGVGPRGRVFLGPPEQTAMSLFAGGGLAIEAGTPAFLSGGVALDALKSNGPRPRVQFDYVWSPAGDSRGLLSAGVVFGRKLRAPVEREPEIVEVPDPVRADGMVWVPGPVCQWLPPDDANAELARLQLKLESVHILNETALRGSPPDPNAQTPARLVVAAFPGDEVEVNGEPLPLSSGLASLRMAEGRAEVKVTGGGRTVSWPVGVAEGNVVWVAVDPPEPQRVQFTAGSAALGPEALEIVAQIASTAGDWAFAIHGSASPEGAAETNQALEQRRAEAVAAALKKAGVPAKRLSTGASVAYPDLPPEQQRAAVIVPVEP